MSGYAGKSIPDEPKQQSHFLEDCSIYVLHKQNKK
jgi:hypothetical protein